MSDNEGQSTPAPRPEDLAPPIHKGDARVLINGKPPVGACRILSEPNYQVALRAVNGFEHPGCDAEELSDSHRETLARYLDWYGYDGVLEAVSQISAIAIGTRSLTAEERLLIAVRCAECDNVIEDTDGPCPYCAEPYSAPDCGEQNA